MRKLISFKTYILFMFGLIFTTGISAALECEGMTGYASWYGRSSHHMVHVADGRYYKGKVYFAASKTLPFGTLLLVKNLYNDRAVIVKIVDRGPFVRGRILDLSYGAAKKLGMIGDGVAKVKAYPLACVKLPKSEISSIDPIKDIIRTSEES